MKGMKISDNCDSILDYTMLKEEYVLKQANILAYKPKVDVKFTDCINAIRCANIIFLDRDVPFEPNSNDIQVKCMNQLDLAKICEGNDTTSMSRHESYTEQDQDIEYLDEFDQRLDVIKLPKPIPHVRFNELPDYLFVRPDEYALFISLTNEGKSSILIGNPDISKSWFQFKYILFCYRQDLFDKLWCRHSNLQLAEKEPNNASNAATGIDSITFSQHNPIDRIKPGALPNFIIRTEGGSQSFLFFVGFHHDCDVQVIRHDPIDMMWFSDRNSTILWEPGSSNSPIRYMGIEAKIIATVSPKRDIFHSFSNIAQCFYMPCPSVIHLRLMGKIMNAAGTDRYLLDDDIIERVNEYGPFIRAVLLWQPHALLVNKTLAENEIQKFCSGLKASDLLVQALESPLHIFESHGEVLSGFSFRLARFVVSRLAKGSLLPYQECTYAPSCKNISNKLQMAILNLPIVDVQKYLVKYDKGMITGFGEWISALLERIFMFHAVSENGLRWKYRRMIIKEANQATPELKSNNWDRLTISLNGQINRDQVLFREMKKEVLFYPDNARFPLVDAYWKDEEDGYLNCVQATKSLKHAKTVQNYEGFMKELKVPSETILRIFFCILPRDKEYFGQSSFPPGQFWKSVHADREKIKLQKDRIEFYALLPPPTFSAVYPK
jgi:hypothetical protein